MEYERNYDINLLIVLGNLIEKGVHFSLHTLHSEINEIRM